MKGLVTAVLCLCVPAVAIADDGLILQEGADLETTHRYENATAAAVTSGVLGYESYELIKMAYEVGKPNGYLAPLEEMSKIFGYGFGGLAGAGSIAMLGLAIHDIYSTPVADARDAYAAGDHAARWDLADHQLSKRDRERRVVAWVSLALDAGLMGYGASQLGSEQHHDLGVTNLWIGGTCALLATTVLLHTREPAAARTHRQLALSASPGGFALAGAF